MSSTPDRIPMEPPLPFSGDTRAMTALRRSLVFPVPLSSLSLFARPLIGAPFKVVPVAEDSHLFNALTASNQRPISMSEEDEEEARSARQLVETTFRFTAHDLKGNRTGGIK